MGAGAVDQGPPSGSCGGAGKGRELSVNIVPKQRGRRRETLCTLPLPALVAHWLNPFRSQVSWDIWSYRGQPLVQTMHDRQEQRVDLWQGEHRHVFSIYTIGTQVSPLGWRLLFDYKKEVSKMSSVLKAWRNEVDSICVLIKSGSPRQDSHIEDYNKF